MKKLYIWLLIVFPCLQLLLYGQKEPQPPKFKVQVNLVSLDVEVLDKNGNLVLGLNRPDFVVEEDGKPMEITNFVLSTGRPISLAMVLDTSALSPEQLGICKTFVMILAHKLDRSDELCLYSFDSRDAYLEQEFTVDRALLMRALDNIGVTSHNSGGALRELLGTIPPTGLGIDLALRDLGEEGRKGKRALLFVSNRFRGLGPALVEHVQQSSCTLLTLAFSHKASVLVTFGDAISARQLRRESGGRQFSAESKDIDGVCRQIAYSLKNYYSIGYLTEIRAGDERPRKIRVRIPGRKYTINFRRTYVPQ